MLFTFSVLVGEEESGHVTRLARTCITDANYDSYTEVTLQCGGGADGQGSYSLIQVKKNKNEPTKPTR